MYVCMYVCMYVYGAPTVGIGSDTGDASSTIGRADGFLAVTLLVGCLDGTLLTAASTKDSALV